MGVILQQKIFWAQLFLHIFITQLGRGNYFSPHSGDEHNKITDIHNSLKATRLINVIEKDAL